MAMPVYPSVAAYLAAQSPDQRRVLQQVRATILKTVPGVDEGISYGIPTYKLGGKNVVYFAGWKQHLSLYPISAGVAKTLAKEMAPYEQSNKGTVRFNYDEPLPVKLITRIVKIRAAEAAAGTAQSLTAANAAKASPAKKPATKKPAAKKPAAKKPAAKKRARGR
jgi:uncharacterized protein YdhG (YjbR/CyaY superfamily)